MTHFFFPPPKLSFMDWNVFHRLSHALGHVFLDGQASSVPSQCCWFLAKRRRSIFVYKLNPDEKKAPICLDTIEENGGEKKMSNGLIKTCIDPGRRWFVSAYTRMRVSAVQVENPQQQREAWCRKTWETSQQQRSMAHPSIHMLDGFVYTSSGSRSSCRKIAGHVRIASTSWCRGILYSLIFFRWWWIMQLAKANKEPIAKAQDPSFMSDRLGSFLRVQTTSACGEKLVFIETREKKNL